MLPLRPVVRGGDADEGAFGCARCLFTKGWVELPKVEIPRSKELTWSTITVFLAVSYGPKRTPLPKGGPHAN
uniref:Uncharacterized protein n=1 Tax=Knipowitschia caucasica TaxID=637954 RepID=A0AAV2KUT2_KNICA